ncbi:MAG: TOBE domain-containing protein, partial [Rhodobacteraceae bacterium]|nr:TOBE domain-containing protein [Paracoccaceae bacterium]
VPTGAGDTGLRVRVGIRPEDFVPTDDPAPAWRGRVEITEALGEVTLLYFAAEEGAAPVIAKLPGIHAGLRRAEVGLCVDPAKVHLFHDGRSLLYR